MISGSPMPVDDAGKLLFFNSCPSDRLNKRIMESLKGRALQKAKQVVDACGSISTSGIYGSIEIDEKDFIEVSRQV